jgi:hypothetical protein
MRFDEKQFASFLGEKNIDVVKPSKSFAPLLLLDKTEDDDDDEAEDEEDESNNPPCANPRQREES